MVEQISEGEPEMASSKQTNELHGPSESNNSTIDTSQNSTSTAQVFAIEAQIRNIIQGKNVLSAEDRKLMEEYVR